MNGNEKRDAKAPALLIMASFIIVVGGMKGASSILVVGLLFGALIGTSLNDFLSSLPDYQERLSAHIVALISWLHEKGVNIPAEEVTGTFNPGWVLRPIFMISSVPMASLVKIAQESYDDLVKSRFCPVLSFRA